MTKLERHTLLGVLLASERAISRIRLMKLLFLLRQDGGSPAFDFFPFRFGPYSWLVQRTLDSLYEDGSVTGAQPAILRREQTETDCSAAPPSLQDGIRRIVDLFAHRSDDDLLSEVYERFPEFTVMSTLGPRQPRATAPNVVFSVGYEGASIDRVLNTLIRSGVRRLLDVRRNPISRRFGFSKSRLSGFCEKIEVEYVHLPELGIASEDRVSLSSKESYRRLLDRYESEMLPEQSRALNRAELLVRDKPSALLCFEADPECCHRSKLSSHLAKVTGLPIIHLSHT